MKTGWMGLFAYVVVIFFCYLFATSGRLEAAVDLLKIVVVVAALIAGLMLTKPSQ